jgi:hypothetical protein
VTATNPPEPVLEVPHGAASVALDQYRGVRLDAAREDVQRRFGVRLQNTRGMVPQIYEAKKMGDIEQLTAHFYDDLLKEFFVVMRQQRTPPDAIEKELREEFGEPKERTEPPAEPGGVGLGGGLAGALGATGAREQPEAKPASFPHRRYLAWDDGRSRVDATIHYNSPDPAACTSLLAVHVSAAKWLNANRSRLGAVVPPPTNLVEQTNAPVAEFEPPKRLFP